MKVRLLVIFFTSFILALLGYWYFYPRIRIDYLLSGDNNHRPKLFQFYDGADKNKVLMASSDFSYSVCLLDLSKSNVHLKVSGWDGYQSVAIYGMDAFHLTSLIAPAGEAIDVILQSKDAKLPHFVNFDHAFLLLRRVRSATAKHGLDTCLSVPLPK